MLYIESLKTSFGYPCILGRLFSSKLMPREKKVFNGGIVKSRKFLPTGNTEFREKFVFHTLFLSTPDKFPSRTSGGS